MTEKKQQKKVTKKTIIADCQHSCQYFLYFLCLPEGIPDWIKMSMVNSSAGTTCSLTS